MNGSEPEKKICPQCGMPVLPTDERCPFCGKILPGQFAVGSKPLEQRHCAQCEMPVLPTDARCPFCGKPQPWSVVSPGRWVLRILSVVGLTLLGIPLALAGLCGVVGGGAGGGISVFLLGLLAFGIVGLLFWAVVAAWKK